MLNKQNNTQLMLSERKHADWCQALDNIWAENYVTDTNTWKTCNWRVKPSHVEFTWFTLGWLNNTSWSCLLWNVWSSLTKEQKILVIIHITLSNQSVLTCGVGVHRHFTDFQLLVFTWDSYVHVLPSNARITVEGFHLCCRHCVWTATLLIRVAFNLKTVP